ncbi:MAG: hypothetical protein JSW54_02915 [Fidelibacterota bacterium]|nr:MAG: hypothetical protein JSW54_02915 [Candidatus Neomarinimicrobiota bacterium]
MFDINLLAKPGIQESIAELEAEENVDREAAIIQRLGARVTAEAPIAEAPPRKIRSRFRIWIVLLIIIVAGVAYWWYRGWDWKPWEELLQLLVTPPPVSEALAIAEPIGTCPVIIDRFMNALPSRASLDFLDVGGGILMYYVQGGDLAQSLLHLNTQIEGYRYHGVVAPRGPGISVGSWLGTVAFDSRDQVGALRPVKSDYDQFFNLLENNVRNTGGVLVAKIPGTMTAGEYHIQGSLGEIQAHVASITHEMNKVHYHRMSILKQAAQVGETYLLRVIFNLIEERVPSPQLSSPGDSGV